MGIRFGGDNSNVVKHLMVIVAQPCEYTKTSDLHTLNR